MTPHRLIDHILSKARTHNQLIAVTDRSGTTVSYGELADRVLQLSEFLRAEGLKPGACVAILQRKTIDYLVTLLGVSACGATYVPLDPEMSVHRIQVVLEDCDPDLFIATPELFHSEIPCQMEICARIPGMNNVCFTVLNSGDDPRPDLAYILYTSGSTGDPKGVCISHEAASAFVEWSLNTFHLRAGDHVASIAPFHFDLSVFDIYASLLTGSTLFLYTTEDIRNVRLMAQELSTKNISVLYATPSFLVAFLLYGQPEKYSWDSLRTILFAGEVFPAKHLHELMQVCASAKFFNLYGPTETNVCTWMEIRRDDSKTEPYPIGFPCAQHEYEISAEGELIVGGPHVAEGYLNKPELTSTRFFTRNDVRWFRTGDIVEQLADGALVYKGRVDRMIKRRGYRVEPAEIEKALLIHPSISACAVVDVKDRNDMMQLIAFLSGEHAPGIFEVKEFLLKYVPDYMLPDAVLTIDELPVTTTGKTDYQQLRMKYAEQVQKES